MDRKLIVDRSKNESINILAKMASEEMEGRCFKHATKTSVASQEF